MESVSCRQCGSCVLVRKNSLAHTLVQWTSDTDRCVQLGGQADRALIPTCTELRASVESSVREGLLPVGDR